MCVFSLRPMRKYIFIYVDIFIKAQDIAYSLCCFDVGTTS